MDANQVNIIRSNLQERLDEKNKDFYIESISDAGVEDLDNPTTQDIDKLLQYFVSTEASSEYQASVFAAIESHLPDYLVSYLANSDRDGDGVSFAEELKIGTNPSVPDSPARQYSSFKSCEASKDLEL